MIKIKKRRQPKPKPEQPPGPAPEPQGMLQHFQPLGYDGDQFFFFMARGKQIRSREEEELVPVVAQRLECWSMPWGSGRVRPGVLGWDFLRLAEAMSVTLMRSRMLSWPGSSGGCSRCHARTP